MYKAIIFDFFDVIRTDAFKSWLTLHNYRLEGAFLEAAQKQDRGEIVVKEFLSLLSEITGQPAHEIVEEMESGAALDHDVLALIERLHHNYKIGLLSNAPSDFLRTLLREHNLEKYFDEVIVSSEIGLIKPHPEIFHHALSSMGVKPTEAIFIDDSPRNIEGSEAVGITSILYTDIHQLKIDLQKFDIAP